MSGVSWAFLKLDSSSSAGGWPIAAESLLEMWPIKLSISCKVFLRVSMEFYKGVKSGRGLLRSTSFNNWAI